MRADPLDNKSRSGEPEAELDWGVPAGHDEGEFLRGKSTTPTGPSFPVEGSNGNGLGVLAEGSQFGVYVVGPCIGEGGMARIYRAEHEGLRRQVALKVLSDGFSRDTEGRERFLREARIAAAIKHPNVVNIFDVGVHQGVTYLVMELLEGEDLETFVQSRGALDEATIVDIIVPVVAGLVAVHDVGIVHRDLKPGNIFLAKGRNDEMEPKLLDFGISKSLAPDQLKLTSANGLLMGTPFYMSPEGIQGKEMTHLSDQYSLGVVLYECATGKNPFMAGSFPEVVNLITTGKYVPPSQHVPIIPKRLCRIIERAMSLDPEKRFKDLREMGRELLLLAGQRTRITWGLSFGDLNRGGLLAKPSEMPPPLNGRGSNGGEVNFRPRRKGAVALVALLALLGAGAAAYLFVPGLQEQLGPRPIAALATTPEEKTMELRGSNNAVTPPDNAAPPPAPVPPPADNTASPPPSGVLASDAPSGTTEESASDGLGAADEDESMPAKAKGKGKTAKATAATARLRRRMAARKNTEATPEWIVPSDSTALAQPRATRGPRLGTNNAPILD
jgi:serine/threonine-protein kinase